jgi:hypothetical protein
MLLILLIHIIERMKIIQSILDKVETRSPPGRFLQIDCNDSRLWYQIEAKVARKKIRDDMKYRSRFLKMKFQKYSGGTQQAMASSIVYKAKKFNYLNAEMQTETKTKEKLVVMPKVDPLISTEIIIPSSARANLNPADVEEEATADVREMMRLHTAAVAAQSEELRVTSIFIQQQLQRQVTPQSQMERQMQLKRLKSDRRMIEHALEHRQTVQIRLVAQQQQQQEHEQKQQKMQQQKKEEIMERHKQEQHIRQQLLELIQQEQERQHTQQLHLQREQQQLEDQRMQKLQYQLLEEQRLQKLQQQRQQLEQDQLMQEFQLQQQIEEQKRLQEFQLQQQIEEQKRLQEFQLQQQIEEQKRLQEFQLQQQLEEQRLQKLQQLQQLEQEQRELQLLMHLRQKQQQQRSSHSAVPNVHQNALLRRCITRNNSEVNEKIMRSTRFSNNEYVNDSSNNNNRSSNSNSNRNKDIMIDEKQRKRSLVSPQLFAAVPVPVPENNKNYSKLILVAAADSSPKRRRIDNHEKRINARTKADIVAAASLIAVAVAAADSSPKRRRIDNHEERTNARANAAATIAVAVAVADVRDKSNHLMTPSVAPPKNPTTLNTNKDDDDIMIPDAAPASLNDYINNTNDNRIKLYNFVRSESSGDDDDSDSDSEASLVF